MTNKTVHINSIFWYILLFVFFLFLVLSIQNKTVLIMFDPCAKMFCPHNFNVPLQKNV